MKRYLIFLLIIVLGLFLFHPATWSQDDEEDYPKEPILFTRPVKAVIFDHKVHVEDNGLSCDSCHDDPFEMEAGSTQEKTDFNMKALYDGQYCGACHDGDTAFASNTQCARCHIGVLGMKRILGIKEEAHH